MAAILRIHLGRRFYLARKFYSHGTEEAVMNKNKYNKARLRAVVSALAIIAISSVSWSRAWLQAQASPALAAQGKTSKDIPVTSTVYDFTDSTNTTPNLLRSDDYNAADHATYTSSSSGGTTLTTHIGPFGNWQLDLYNQMLRTLWITPNDPINASQPVGPPPGYYWENVEAYSQCYDQHGNFVPFPNLVNGSNHCSLGVDFNSGGTKYKLVMSPSLPATGPATGLANVTCNAVSNSQCVSWTITPNAVAANPRVANLYKYDKRGNLVFVGQYFNTYRISATNP
jgi:hypothetical protein